MNPENPLLLTCCISAIGISAVVVPNFRKTVTRWLLTTLVLALVSVAVWLLEVRPDKTIILSDSEKQAALMLFLIGPAIFLFAGVPDLKKWLRWIVGCLTIIGFFATSAYILKNKEAHELSIEAERIAADQMLALVRSNLTGVYDTRDASRGDSPAQTLARKIGKACTKTDGYRCELISDPVASTCALTPKLVHPPAAPNASSEGVSMTVDTYTEMKITPIQRGEEQKMLDGTITLHVTALGVWMNGSIQLLNLVPIPDMATAVDRTPKT